MTDFSKYTGAVFQAFETCPVPDDVVTKKASIIEQVCQTNKLSPKNILFVGFNPAMFSTAFGTVFVTEIDLATRAKLDKLPIKYQYVDRSAWPGLSKKFDCVVAAEEYLTFASNDQQQHELVENLAAVTKHCLITTVKDYKNLEYKEREFSLPAVIKNSDEHVLFFEYHNYDPQNRGSWQSTVYMIQDQQLACFGPYARRAMYFKQMAKFSSDAGGQMFTVHKNLMYKSLIKKNYEHVVSVKF